MVTLFLGIIKYMQHLIDEALDLCDRLFADRYNFTAIHSYLAFCKSKEWDDINYRCIQVLVSGAFLYEGEEVYLPLSGDCILTFADPTYEEVLVRLIEEFKNPDKETIDTIENRVIKGAIERSKK